MPLRFTRAQKDDRHVDRANERLAELNGEREKLVSASEIPGGSPQIDAGTAMTYRRGSPKLLKHATPVEKRELIRPWVEEIRLTPEQVEVAITFRVPEPVVNRLVAGA